MAFLSLILKGGRMTINEKLTMIGKAKKMLPLCVLFFIQAYYTFLITRRARQTALLTKENAYIDSIIRQ